MKKIKLEQLERGDKIRIETTLTIIKDKNGTVVYVYPESGNQPAEMFSEREFNHLFNFLKAKKLKYERRRKRNG